MQSAVIATAIPSVRLSITRWYHLDSQLTMADHIAALNRSCFFHLWRIRSINQSLMQEATRTLVHAFVSSRLDGCNSLLAGVSSQLLNKLQVVKNAEARLVTGARRSEHITPVLRDPHWLPIRQRVTFKTAVLMIDWKILSVNFQGKIKNYWNST